MLGERTLRMADNLCTLISWEGRLRRSRWVFYGLGIWCFYLSARGSWAVRSMDGQRCLGKSCYEGSELQVVRFLDRSSLFWCLSLSCLRLVLLYASPIPVLTAVGICTSYRGPRFRSAPYLHHVLRHRPTQLYLQTSNSGESRRRRKSYNVGAGRDLVSRPVRLLHHQLGPQSRIHILHPNLLLWDLPCSAHDSHRAFNICRTTSHQRRRGQQ
jgi:hypothetical protein